MSFWDRYLAPGDVRAQRVTAGIEAERVTESEAAQRPPPAPRIDAAHRARRQNALFFGGLAFTGLSLLITRRALRKRMPPPAPAQTTPANTVGPEVPPPKVEGSFEAVEALGLATLNVFSIAMATAGGLMKYFDVADIEDMRENVRKGLGFDVYGGDADADKEMEAWVADILSRKEGLGNLKEGIAEKLAELEEKEAKRKANNS